MPCHHEFLPHSEVKNFACKRDDIAVGKTFLIQICDLLSYVFFVFFYVIMCNKKLVLSARINLINRVIIFFYKDSYLNSFIANYAVIDL